MASGLRKIMVTPAYNILAEAIAGFIRHDVTTMGAALAFFTALSMAPLLIILVAVGGVLGQDALYELVLEVNSVVGPQAAAAIDLILRNAQQEKESGFISAVVGAITILFSATAVFGQLQFSMNKIWELRRRAVKGFSKGVLAFFKKRLLSLGLILAIGFLLLLSLVLSAAFNLIFSQDALILQWVDLGVSLSVYTVLFALIFQYLPDTRVAWRDVWGGAAATALMFALGKFAIGKYLGLSSVGSAYGAAGSLVVLLAWVYYSSIILFFGAELARAYSLLYGSRKHLHQAAPAAKT